MIETREALRNLQQIVAVPGIDALFVGPADLGLELGVPITLRMHEKVLQEIDNMVSACEAHGVLSGAATFNLDNDKDLIRRGVKVVTLGADVAYLRRGAQPDADYCKSLRMPTIARASEKDKEDDSQCVCTASFTYRLIARTHQTSVAERSPPMTDFRMVMKGSCHS